MARAQARKKRWAPRQLSSLPAGPFVGMRDAADPTSGSPELARLLLNCYPIAPEKRGRVEGVPGVWLTTGQGGSVGKRTGQLVAQFTELDGTEHTVRIVGGQFYEYDWAFDTWTEVLDAADFSGASITLSQTARCYAVTFANKLIVTDGVNTPWAWDGTSGGGLTKLTACPVLYGPPVVHYGKLFGIKNADRSTFVWSEEADPTLGYDSAGYNNAWQLGQTDQNALFRLYPTNEALYVFRARSITTVLGAVNDDFSSSGTRESVSDTEGTISPDTVFGHRNYIYFLNADGKPHAIVPGSGVVPIWFDFEQTLFTLEPTEIDTCQGFWDPLLELARFPLVETNESLLGFELCYHNKLGTPQAACIIRGLDWQRLGVVKNGDGHPRVMGLDDDGYAMVQGSAKEEVWSWESPTGTTKIEHKLYTPYVGYDELIEKHFSRVDAILYVVTNITGLTMRYETSRGYGPTLTSGTITGSPSLWDVAVWDVSPWTASVATEHIALGLDGNGRYISGRFEHDALAERFGFTTVRFQAQPIGPFPRTP